MRTPFGGSGPNTEEPLSAGESGVDKSDVQPDFCSISPSENLPCAPLVHDIPPSVISVPIVSFEEFATQYRRRKQAEAQKWNLENHLLATKVSICLTSRLLRAGATVQKGLVEVFKHGDKPSFISIYNTIHDTHDVCEATSRPTLLPNGPSEDSTSLHPQRNRHSGFMHQLSLQCRKDLLEILTLIRTDSQFLVDRITGLSPSQLSALTSSVVCSGPEDLFLSLPSSRSRNSPSFVKRAGPSFVPFKDHALAFERSDSLAALLFNVFAVPLDWDLGESELRLDVWSSTSAKLLSTGDTKYHTFVGHVLSYWSLCSDWQARPKIELYLMDVLQKGAFLLENIENPVSNPYGVESPDPLRTDAAEEFFETAVQTLFEVLDDSDAGLPSTALEFGSAILTKLPDTETKDRFLEYIFVQWLFAKFLYNALTFPESQGLLLDFHISKEAREKLLGQIALRAQSQIYRVLHSVPQFSTVHPKVRQHVEDILKKFVLASNMATNITSHTSGGPPLTTEENVSDSSRFLMLSAMDVVTLLNALFPRTNHSQHGSLNSPFTALDISQGGPKRGTIPAHWSGRIDTVLEQSTQNIDAQKPPLESPYNRKAELIRFDLSDIGETEDRPILDHPSTEDWTVLTISDDGKSLTWDSSTTNDSSGMFDGVSEDGHRSVTIHPEENYEALQTAIVRLVNESEKAKQPIRSRATGIHQSRSLSLKSRFDRARTACENRSDFLGAHYWWTASHHLAKSLSKLNKPPPNDTWVLSPMLRSSNDAFTRWSTVIDDCEGSLMTLTPIVDQLKDLAKDNLARMAKLRNKMWYMTDVKNSMRYEDAKHVALALKTMVYPNFHRDNPNEYRSRHGSRYLPGAFLQKPEMQVMNVMKASSSQGGPNKLSDEQVELTRKWITHHGIDNFCRGEERIHRFCYEVKSSINKLVGDTMAETPVLWASELFQKERAKFEGPSSRSFPGIASTPGARPVSHGSDDVLLSTQFPSLGSRATESSRSQDNAPFMQKFSYQTLSSEKWRSSKNVEVDTISSLGGSSTKAASTSTSDSFSTFWSPLQTQAQSAASASSFQSRPPSMFSDVPTPRRVEQVVHGKTAFLDELRQTLTSLLLSDLGSPVWSCGSETDAWFMNFLNQKRVQVQMNKEASIQKFLVASEKRIRQRTGRPVFGRNSLRHRRTQSADSVLGKDEVSPRFPAESDFDSLAEQSVRSDFAYKAAFSRLLDVFSRNANPYVKLGALRDLRALVVASLNSASEITSVSNKTSTARNLNLMDNPNLKRHSFVETLADEEYLRTPTSPVPESVGFESRPSYDILSTSESQIIKTMKSLLNELQPKTLFRDLQFVSAFVPSETLNKTDSGTAFLQFGLAALSLKDDVCSSMVELADRIVSQELNQRHLQTFETTYRPQDPIEDAARMWIITAKEGNAVAQRELAILYLTHPEILPRVTFPLTLPRDTFKAEMMYRRDRDSKSDPQSMCLALHWMQLSASGGDELARNRLREREEFESLV
ncbi:hypothetical protein BGW36DRAFT_356321 [Talaromyces proteolyticus]|uniref:Uncharacterized protein n=1 Tax=Talaromyces proteolyticus TaxID=1131652 RepID=A0AAD4PZ30_9EURO|nr:uncharacterized protein BGW36DRAFT_356321 [Talaromyces proteolyticus]KAH8702185.1 hypothetical protein BGW36DRAFT_356321 [Talaromyces proteolyticus]